MRFKFRKKITRVSTGVLVVGLLVSQTLSAQTASTADGDTADQLHQEVSSNKELLEIWKDHVRTLTRERDEAYKELETIKTRQSDMVVPIARATPAQFGGIETQPLPMMARPAGPSPEMLRTLEGLKDRVSQLQSELKKRDEAPVPTPSRDLTTRVVELEKANDRLQKEAADAQSDRDRIIRDKELALSRNETLEERVSQLQAQADSFKPSMDPSQLRTAQTELRDEREKTRLLTSSLEDLQAELESIRSQTSPSGDDTARLKELEAINSELQNAMVVLETQLRSKEQQFVSKNEGAENEAKYLRSMVKEIQAELERLKANPPSQASPVDASSVQLEREKEDALRQVREAQFENEALKARIEKLAVVEKELTDTRAYLTPIIKDLQDENAKATAESRAFQAERGKIEALADERAQLQARSRELETRVKEQEAELGGTQTELEEIRQQNQKLAAEAQAEAMSREEAESALAALRSQLQNASKSASRTQKELADSQAAIERYERENQELASAQSQIRDLSSQSESLRQAAQAQERAFELQQSKMSELAQQAAHAERLQAKYNELQHANQQLSESFETQQQRVGAFQEREPEVMRLQNEYRDLKSAYEELQGRFEERDQKISQYRGAEAQWAKLQADYDALNRTYADLQRRYDSNHARLETLEAGRPDSERLKAERERFEQMSRELQTQVDTLSQQLSQARIEATAAAQQALAAQTAQLDELRLREKDLLSLQKTANEQAIELERRSLQEQAYQKELADIVRLRAAHDAQSVSQAAQLRTLSSERETLGRALGVAKRDLESQAKIIEALRAKEPEIAKLHIDFDALQKENGGLKTSFAAVQKSLADSQARLAQLPAMREELTMVSKKYAQAQDKLASHEAQIVSYQQREPSIQKLQADFSELEKAHAVLATSRQELQTLVENQKQKLEASTTQIGQLAGAVADRESLRKSLEESQKNLESQTRTVETLQAKEPQIAKLGADFDALKKAYASLSAEQTQTSAQLDGARLKLAEAQKLQAEIAGLSKQIADAKEVIQFQQSKISGYETREPQIAKLQADFAALQKNYESLSKTYGELQASSKQSVESQAKTIESLRLREPEVAKLRADFDALTKTYAEQNQKLETASRQLGTLADVVADRELLKKNSVEAEKNLQLQAKIIEALRAKEPEIAKLHIDFDALQKENGGLKTSFAAVQKSLADSQARLAQLPAMREELTMVSKKYAQAQDKLASHEAQIVSYQQQEPLLQKLQAEFSELQKAHEVLKQTADSLRQNAVSLKASEVESKKLSEELASVVADRESLRKSLGDLEAAHEALQTKSQAYKAAAEDTATQILVLKSQLQTAQSDLEKLKEAELSYQQTLTENGALRKSLVYLESRSSGQEEKLQALTLQTDSLKKNNLELRAQRADQAKTIETLRTNLQSTLSDMRNLKSNFESYLESIVEGAEQRQKPKTSSASPQS